MCPVFQLREQLLQNFSCSTRGLYCGLWGCGFLSESFSQIPVLAKKNYLLRMEKTSILRAKLIYTFCTSYYASYKNA